MFVDSEHYHVQETSWDYLSFVTWCVVLYKATATRRWVHCDYKGMDMVRSMEALGFKPCSVGTEGPKVCQENMPTSLQPKNNKVNH